MNPLLIGLNESKANGDDETKALIKLMMILRMDMGPQSILDATNWHLEHGEPTWESMRQWAIEFAEKEPGQMETLITKHREITAENPSLAEYLSDILE